MTPACRPRGAGAAGRGGARRDCPPPRPRTGPSRPRRATSPTTPSSLSTLNHWLCACLTTPPVHAEAVVRERERAGAGAGRPGRSATGARPLARARCRPGVQRDQPRPAPLPPPPASESVDQRVQPVLDPGDAAVRSGRSARSRRPRPRRRPRARPRRRRRSTSAASAPRREPAPPTSCTPAATSSAAIAQRRSTPPCRVRSASSVVSVNSVSRPRSRQSVRATGHDHGRQRHEARQARGREGEVEHERDDERDPAAAGEA